MFLKPFTANLLEGKQTNVCLKNVSTAFSLEPCWKTLEIWLTLPYFSSIRHILAQKKILPWNPFFKHFELNLNRWNNPSCCAFPKITLYEDTCSGSSGWRWQKSTSYLRYFAACCCCCCGATTGLTVTADAQQEECPPPPSDKFWQL